jgi:hypothetical protein
MTRQIMHKDIKSSCLAQPGAHQVVHPAHQPAGKVHNLKFCGHTSKPDMLQSQSGPSARDDAFHHTYSSLPHLRVTIESMVTVTHESSLSCHGHHGLNSTAHSMNSRTAPPTSLHAVCSLQLLSPLVHLAAPRGALGSTKRQVWEHGAQAPTPPCKQQCPGLCGMTQNNL